MEDECGSLLSHTPGFSRLFLRCEQVSFSGKTMKKLLQDLWRDEAGFLLSAELVVIATVAVLGLTVMLVAVRDSVGGELTDLANSLRNIDQSYGYGGMRGHQTQQGYTSWTAGSKFLDPHLREPGSEQDIVVEDHIVGCRLPYRAAEFSYQPCPAPTWQPVVSPCVIPCPQPCEPGCTSCPDGIPVPPATQELAPIPATEIPISGGLIAPCIDCPQGVHQSFSPGTTIPGQPGVEHVIENVIRQTSPRYGHEIPTRRFKNHSEPGYPPLSYPVTKIPAGPLQVW